MADRDAAIELLQSPLLLPEIRERFPDLERWSQH